MKFENFNNIDFGNELFYKVRDLLEYITPHLK